MDDDRLLTKEDVCTYLGVKPSWLESEIQRGELPHIRLGKKKFIRFRREHIEAYLAAKENRTQNNDDDVQPQDHEG